MTGRHRGNDDASSSWQANRFRKNNATGMPSHRERTIQHHSIGAGRRRRVNNSRLEKKLNAARKLNFSNFLSKIKTKF